MNKLTGQVDKWTVQVNWTDGQVTRQVDLIGG